MRALIAVFSFGFVASLFADEIILENGSTIKWRLIEDKGDSYRITKKDGHVITVSKASVSRFVKKKETPITGAIVNEDLIKKEVDLLGSADLKGASGGKWVLKDGVLSSPVGTQAKLVISHEYGEEYDLKIVVRLVDGSGSFSVSLPVGSSRMNVWVDSVDGKGAGVNGFPSTYNNQKIFRNSRSHILLYQVRKNQFVFSVDNKIVVDWKTPKYEAAQVPRILNVNSPGMVLACDNSLFRFEKVSSIRWK